MTDTTVLTTPGTQGGTTQRAARGARFLPSTCAVALRTVRKFARTPQLIVVTTVQSALWLLIFRYIFGGAIGVQGLSYVDFLVPGVVVTMALWSGMGAAAGVAEDVEQGLFDRLRSLPIPRSAVLAGRCLADTALAAWGLVVATGIGFAIGFRLHGSVGDALAAFGLCVAFGFALEWIFIVIGLVAGNAQAAQGMSMVIVPFTFVSGAYVPVDSMPGWLRAFGDHQPITPMVSAVRSLTGGARADTLLAHGTGYYVTTSLVWSAGLVLVFGLLSVLRFSRR